MTSISIALSSYSDFTAVNVEGLGVINVRRESSNHGLKRSELLRDLFKLQDDSKDLQKKVKKLVASGKGEDDPEIIKLNKQGSDKLNRITELHKEEQLLRRARLFDDEGGVLVEKLFEHATDEDIAKLFAIADDASDSSNDGLNNE